MEKPSKLHILAEDPQTDAPSWYQEGLRFKCTGCGKCCTGQPGYVWVTEEEIQQIADFLKITKEKMMRSYIRQKEGRYSLIEKRALQFDCVFLKDNKCEIYPVRPKQCRTYPWWAQNLTSPEAWRQAAIDCEGIRNDAPLIPFDEIEKHLS